jgi:hypothetical protein
MPLGDILGKVSCQKIAWYLSALGINDADAIAISVKTDTQIGRF